MAKRDLRHLLKTSTDVPLDAAKGEPPQVPLLRKFHIYPQQNGMFACGFCMKKYRSADYAWMCVATCSEPVLQDLRVISCVRGFVMYHFCPICLKQFPNREDGVLCVEKCRDNVMSLLPSEAGRLALLAAYNAESEETVRETRELDRGHDVSQGGLASSFSSSSNFRVSSQISDEELNTMVPVLGTGSQLSDLNFVVEDEPHPSALAEIATHGAQFALDSHANDKPVVERAAANSEAAAPEDSAESVKPASLNLLPDETSAPAAGGKVNKWKPGMKPFRRDGAQYVCNACGERYFSKKEVESCFSADAAAAVSQAASPPAS